MAAASWLKARRAFPSLMYWWGSLMQLCVFDRCDQQAALELLLRAAKAGHGRAQSLVFAVAAKLPAAITAELKLTHELVDCLATNAKHYLLLNRVSWLSQDNAAHNWCSDRRGVRASLVVPKPAINGRQHIARGKVRIRRWAVPSSPIAARAALMRLLSARASASLARCASRTRLRPSRYRPRRLQPNPPPYGHLTAPRSPCCRLPT